MRTLRTFTGTTASGDASDALGREVGPGATFISRAPYAYRSADGRAFGIVDGVYPELVEFTAAEAVEVEARHHETEAANYEAKAANASAITRRSWERMADEQRAIAREVRARGAAVKAVA
jgi:hypothetical protein